MITRYLFGELSDDEQSRLEEQYFADPALSHEVHAVRDDLVDAYVRGELNPTERERFEKYFMASSTRRERVEFASALAQVSAPQPETAAARPVVPASISWWRTLIEAITVRPRLLIPVAALVLLAFVSWITLRSLPLWDKSGGRVGEQIAKTLPEQNPPAIEPQTEASPGGGALPAPPTDNTPTPAPSRRPPQRQGSQLATLFLTSGLRGEEGPNKLLIPRGTELVLLRFALGDDGHKSYRAEIRTPGGDEVWGASRIEVRKATSGRIVTLRIPARLFKDEDYILKISSVPDEGAPVDVDRFYFRAEIE